MALLLGALFVIGVIVSSAITIRILLGYDGKGWQMIAWALVLGLVWLIFTHRLGPEGWTRQHYMQNVEPSNTN